MSPLVSSSPSSLLLTKLRLAFEPTFRAKLQFTTWRGKKLEGDSKYISM
jgi:hypothetical protein